MARDDYEMPCFWKQPYEQFVIAANFDPDLAAHLAPEAEIVAEQSTALARDKDGNDATSDVIVSESLLAQGHLLKIMVKGGDPALSPYVISFRCVTTASEAYELDVSMEVIER